MPNLKMWNNNNYYYSIYKTCKQFNSPNITNIKQVGVLFKCKKEMVPT